MPHPGVSAPSREAHRDEVIRGTRDSAYVRGAGVAGRRTVTIRGRGAERYAPPPRDRSRRPYERPHERAGFRPDRVALWAVVMGIVLVLAAATSSHAAVLAAHALAH